MNKSESQKLIRTTVMLPVELNRAMRRLAESEDRPLAREVRRALEAHVENNPLDEAA